MNKRYVVNGKAMAFYNVRYVVAAESEEDAIQKVKQGIYGESEITSYIVPPNPFECEAQPLFEEKEDEQRASDK